jgi:ABC-type glutathione transport system ATPase component
MAECTSTSPGQGASKDSLQSPSGLAQRIAGLTGQRNLLVGQEQGIQASLTKLRAYLNIAGKVGDALEVLSQQLFEQLLKVIQEKLTIALQEVLDQPICFKAQAEWKRNAASVQFWIERNGQPEDIMKGQGGSVANILSVGLRMFALTTLDESIHQRFLVLDEQDCWIRPDLVPRLVKIVHDAGKALGFQVLMISHHELGTFAQYADRIYRFEPDGDGVRAELWSESAAAPDQAT